MELLVISFSPLHRDPRVYRQLIFLKDYFQFNINITVSGYSDPNLDWVKYIKVKMRKHNILGKIFRGIRLKLNLFERFYWNDESVKDAMLSLKGKHFDIIIANDINTLPLVIFLSKDTGAKVLLDCHEYSPREFDDRFIFNFFLKDYWDHICSTYIPKVDAAITVCKSIADEYKKNYGGEWQVITNAPFYEKLEPNPVKNNKIRIIHHGGLNPSRKIEMMIHLVDLLDDRFQLDFMFVNSNPAYLTKLKQLSKNNARVRFRDPVPMTKISITINDYDMGLYLLPTAGFNNQMALPNKFFEFIQARLAVAIWPSPEMAKITQEYNCGVVSDEFSVESMAKALNALSNEDIMYYKMNSDKAARSLCAEKNGELFTSLLSSLLN
jgi:glycosyltransferase involved in cell wall biosynthesis